MRIRTGAKGPKTAKPARTLDDAASMAASSSPAKSQPAWKSNLKPFGLNGLVGALASAPTPSTAMQVESASPLPVGGADDPHRRGGPFPLICPDRDLMPRPAPDTRSIGASIGEHANQRFQKRYGEGGVRGRNQAREFAFRAVSTAQTASCNAVWMPACPQRLSCRVPYSSTLD